MMIYQGRPYRQKNVKKARKEEIGYVKKHGVYQKFRRGTVPAGEKIIKVRWIDRSKGDEAHPDIRSRLVAKDYNNEDRPELFAGTPPIEAMKIICSEAAGDDGYEKVVW